MKAAIISAIIFCLALIGLAAYIATQSHGGGPRLVPMSEAYNQRLANGGWVKGSTTPKVEIVFYGDLQSEGSAQIDYVLMQAVEDNKDIARITFHNYILSTHDKAPLAAKAVEAAGRQGKFWEMKQLILANQRSWLTQTPDQFKKTLVDDADSAGIDLSQFNLDLQDSSIDDPINADITLGNKVPIANVPTVTMNGKTITPLPITTGQFSDLIKAAANDAKP